MLRKLMIIAAVLVLLTLLAPLVLAQQENAGEDPSGGEPQAPPDPAFTTGVGSNDTGFLQYGEARDAAPGTSGVCEHAPGEFLVGYVSEEAFQAAPQENVVDSFPQILVQHLVFDDIKSIADPDERLAAEEAKRQELSARPGVSYAEYNCIQRVQEAT